MERIPKKENEKEEEDMFYSPERMEEKDEGIGAVCSSACNFQEKEKLGHLRAIIEKHDPACKDVDNPTLRRFLHARDHDVEKASAMLMKYFAWRQTFVTKGFILPSEIKNQLAEKKVFMQGTDKRGCPVAVIFGARHFPCKSGGDTDEFKRLVVFAFDKVCSRIPDGQEKFKAIVDLQGYGYSNIDVRGYIAILSILQDYYPERLGRLFFVHVPYIFATVWKIVYPFVDEKTKKKVKFVESNKLKATLLEEMDENQLPEIYGGKLQLVPIQDG